MFQIRSEQYAAMRRKKLGDTLIKRLEPFVKAGWDGQERRVLLRDEAGPKGALSFDRQGFLGAYTSPLGRTWQLKNRQDGKLLELVSPSGHTLSLGYHAEGLLATFGTTTQARIQLFYDRSRYVASQYSDGSAESVAYTAPGDPAVFSSRLGNRTLCSYDGYRRLTGIVDGNGHGSHFLYDRWNRPEQVLHPNGQREAFAYDDEGRLCRATCGETSFAEVETDAKGRPLTLRYNDGLEASYAYNEGGLLAKAEAAGVTTTFAYNADGQFTEEITGPETHTLAYDAGKRLSAVTTLGTTVKFDWDSDSRLSGFTDWSGAHHLVEYLPGDRGQVMTGPSQAGRPGVRSFLRTDTAGRVASLQVVAAGQTSFSLACSYDTEGRLSTSEDSAFGRHAYSYDADSRVVYADAADSGSREIFAYDRANNLAASNGVRLVYDAANQLLEAGKTALRWDDRGNLLESSGPEGVRRYRWNGRNQMVASVADDGTETAYTYDALGRRTSKRTGDVETRFYWAGEQMLCEIRADLHTGELHRQDFLYHPETGVPLATAVDGEVYTIQTDHLGTPRALVSGTGEVVWLAELSSYGVARVVVHQVPMPLRFRGQYFDAETGLHYNRFRYYAPQWGRYISRDPLTFAAGTNHYAYVDGNPLNATDAYGLWGWKTIAVIGAAVAVGALVVVFAPLALPLAIIAGAAAGGAVAGGLNEALNEKELNLQCIARAAGLGALAGAVGALPFVALPATAGVLAFAGAGAMGGALSYGVSCLDGAERNPSWGGLAGSVALGGAFGALGKGVGHVFGGEPAQGAVPELGEGEAVSAGEATDPEPVGYTEATDPAVPANDNIAPTERAFDDRIPKATEETSSAALETTDAPPAADTTDEALSPAQQAAGWQGNETYPGVDDWSNVTLQKGDLVVGAVPGQGDFYTNLGTLNGSNGSAVDYYDNLQIAPNLNNPAYPAYRSGVTVYQVDSETAAATSQTLANPDLGSGGGQQFYIPGSQGKLTPLYSIPFKP